MNNIPKVLWYSLSLCIFILTVVFSFIAIKASSISFEYENKKFEIANEKLSLASDVSEINRLKKELFIISEKLKEKETLLATIEISKTTKSFSELNIEKLKIFNMKLNALSVSEEAFEKISKSLENLKPEINSSQLKN